MYHSRYNDTLKRRAGGSSPEIMDKVKFENIQVPLHYQIADYLIDRLSRGELDPEERLMPEEELREIFDVSRTTIRKALEHLLKKGLLYRKQGKGTFWTEAAHVKQREKLSGINREIFNVKKETTVSVLYRAPGKASPEIARFLDIKPEDEVMVFKRMRRDHNNEPMSFTINYLPVKLGDRISKRHLSAMTMMETLEKVLHLQLGTVEHEVEITRSDAETAERLKISVLDPVLTINTRVFDSKKRPVEIVWTHFVESKYKFRVILDK